MGCTNHFAIFSHSLLIVFLTTCAAKRCPLSARTEYYVKQCPEDKKSTNMRAEIKDCDRLAGKQTCTNSSNKFKYHCLPTDLSGTLVEVCAVEIDIHGVCVFYNNTELQTDNNINCSQSSSCPGRFLSTEAHLYDPCESIELTSTIPSTNKTLTFVPEDNSKEHTTVFILIAVTILFCMGLAFYILKRWKNSQRMKKTVAGESEDAAIRIPQRENISEVPEYERPLLTHTDPSHETCANSTQEATDNRVTEVSFNNEAEEGVPSDTEEDVSSYSGYNSLVENYGVWKTRLSALVENYGVWKTRLSDQFSRLTVDEVSVLFYFLCSDFGPPDFADTEWLDLLNKIRQDVYDEENPVTREEAQQTLDRLKSRDYLWEDQDKITEDTKDETMYRIASRKSYIPFYYSTYDTASVYLRSKRYNREPGEKCVISNNTVIDSLLILRIQINILTHVTMEDTSIYDKIHKILNIPEKKIKSSKDEREEFLKELRREGETVHYKGRSQNSVDHVTWLWRYEKEARPDVVRSCIGLHPHWDIYIIDNKPYRKPSKILGYPTTVRCLLYCLLISDKYRIGFIEQSHRITKDKIRQRYFPDIANDGSLDPPDGITETRDGVMTFISDDIRHDVMYAFVTECLVEDSDLEFFLTMAARDVISEYCRTWYYKRSEGERCLYVPDRPEKMYDLFIDKLQLDIITHCTVSDNGIHKSIRNRLGLPYEVLQSDQMARKRYVEYAKRGTQTVHHARGMIVGCAGAGKTTLIKRLLGCGEEDVEKVESTEGFKVHEEIFDICDETKSFTARTKYQDNENGDCTMINFDSKTLSFFDFGGQYAYYACHQVYLTRRAFYVVVVDASKCFDQKVDKTVCDQDGSVFSEWTYGDYFVFWLKSIHNYCSSDDVNDPKPVVLIVATHWEEGIRQFKDKNELMESLQDQLPKASNLSQYLRQDRFHCIQLSLPLDDLERSFYNIACHQRWKESIPKEWLFFQIEINRKKYSKRIMKISEISTKVPETTADCQKSSDKVSKGTLDMLRYYHDAGKVLYFDEIGLKESLVIDVQWVIDAFKHIITDKLHFTGIPGNMEDWHEYYVTGKLRNNLLREIWKRKDEELLEQIKMENKNDKFQFVSFQNDERYLGYHQESLLNFMQRLGLLVVGREYHYVPCMNRKEMESAVPDIIRRSESKSSVLIYRFTFLPFFFFFRLVVACMQEENWKLIKTHDTPCLYKDAALFSVLGYTVVLSVTNETIQLQIFHSRPGCVLERDKTLLIQERVENILNDFTGKFHRKVLFKRGFRCRMDDTKLIALDINDHFLLENDIPKDAEEMICPLHIIFDQHLINAKELTRYWKM